MKPRGLTVLEVIVAAALFAASMLVLVGVFPISARAVRGSEVRLIATHLAHDRLERARATSFASLATVAQAPMSAQLTGNGSTENVTLLVTQTVTLIQPGLKHVIASVDWTRYQQSYHLQLETDIASTLP